MSSRLRGLSIAAAVLGAALLTAPLSLAWPGAAERGSQGPGLVAVPVGGPEGEKVLDVEAVQVAVRGDLVVKFHGARKSDCLSHGLCGYRGQIVLHPEREGFIAVAKYRIRHHIVHEVTLFLDSGYSGAGFSSHTVRSVNGSTAGLCADATQSGLGSTVDSRTGRLTLSLLQAGDGVLSTRCAGPMDGDVARAAPRLTVSERSLLKRGRRIDLSGTHGFLGHGFAGTVTSTIVLQVRSVQHEPLGGGKIKGKTVRVRFVTEKLDVVRTSGALSATVHGSTNQDVCVLLDSCGLAGTLSWSPAPAHATAELTAAGLASRPRRDFLAALGLGGKGNPRGIGVSGAISWTDGGSLAERVTQGGATCSDTTRLGSGGLGLQVRRSELVATYVPVSGLRTRCPGPFVDTGLSNLAAGTVTRSGFDKRRFTIRLLSTDGSARDDGYTARLSGHLALVIKHTRQTTQQVTAIPADAVSLFF